jgi:hypothetical protein
MFGIRIGDGMLFRDRILGGDQTGDVEDTSVERHRSFIYPKRKLYMGLGR